LIYFSSFEKQAIFAYINHNQIHSWNQPVLSNESKGFNVERNKGGVYDRGQIMDDQL